MPQRKHNLKVPYYEKHIFSGLYIYEVVLSKPANSQNEKNKWLLHGLCSPPTGKMVLLQAVQIQLLSLHNERSYLHRTTSSVRWYEIAEMGAFIPEVKFGVSSSKLAVFPVSSLRVRHTNYSVVGCKRQHAYILSQLQNNRRDRRLCFIFNDNMPAAVRVSLYVCVLTTSHQTALVRRVSTKLALPRHWPS